MDAKNDFFLDLQNEEALGKYLDKCYPTLQGLSNYTIERKTDSLSQKLGIDLVLIDKRTGNTINVDEKAQLHYLNRSLKTFTFEVSYFLHSNWKKGWFYDQTKTTNTYFLITCIQGDTKKALLDLD